MPRQSAPQTVFGRRLRQARERVGIPQDKLGVEIGIDEGSSSARVSRYETGKHEPSFPIAERLADALRVPVAYFYCPDDKLATLIVAYHSLRKGQKEQVQRLVAELSRDT